MPAMCTDFLKLHFLKKSLHAHTPLQSDLVQNRGKSSHLDGLVIRYRYGVSTRRVATHNHMAASLPLQSITDSAQSSEQFVSVEITRQFHAASKMRSSSRCSLIRPGFSVASAKWQLTASFTIDSSSSHESPCVAIMPSGRRQFAVKPPSSAGRTRKISSRSFIS